MKDLLIITISICLSLSACSQKLAQNLKKETPATKQIETKEKIVTIQSELPYYQIPDYPEDFSAPNVLARTIDGLGYRYYWATEDLRQTDLEYKPSEDSRTSGETLEHLHGLASFIANGIMDQPNVRPRPKAPETWELKRKETLENLKKASDLLKGMQNIDDLKITFQRGDNVSEMSFWHMFNGPLADALYHVGQIVAYRRASGNPMHPGVNVFMGKTDDGK